MGSSARIAVAQSTVARYLPRPRKPPARPCERSDQSSGRDCGHRLFHRANGDLPDLFVFVVLSHHRRRVLHFGVTEYPGLGWFCTTFAHISRTLTFLRFLFLAAANLLFSLQASVAHPR
jgi:hypothetical protein